MRTLIRSILLSLLLVLLLSCAALAADYDGYIVRVRSDVALFSERVELPDGMTEVYASEGLYTADCLELVDELEDAGVLVYAEPNYFITLEDVPEDAVSWSNAMVGMDTVWGDRLTDAAQGGARVRIGVLDSGLYRDHEAFSDTAIVDGTNYCASKEDAARADTSDNLGHGTFVTGLIAAGQGTVRGVAPDAEIVPLKCFDSKSGSIANVVAAIYGGVDDYHCQVLNMSFGVVESTALKSMEDAIAYAAQQGVILVAAVGNLSQTSTGDDPLMYPAAYDQVIGVGAVDKSRQVDLCSCQNASVFLTAPGRDLDGLGITAPTQYKIGSGTSYAAPFVTAAAALALAVDPTLTQADLEALLRTTAEDLGAEGYDYAYGYGLLRVDRLLRALLPQWQATREEDGFLLNACLSDLPPSEAVTIAAALYSADGRFIQVYLLQETSTEQGALTLQSLHLQCSDETAQLKLLLMDADYAPIRESWKLE